MEEKDALDKQWNLVLLGFFVFVLILKVGVYERNPKTKEL